MKGNITHLEVAILKSDAETVLWENGTCLQFHWPPMELVKKLCDYSSNHHREIHTDLPLVRDDCYQWYPSLAGEKFGSNKSDFFFF